MGEQKANCQAFSCKPVQAVVVDVHTSLEFCTVNESIPPSTPPPISRWLVEPLVSPTRSLTSGRRKSWWPGRYARNFERWPWYALPLTSALLGVSLLGGSKTCSQERS